MIEMTPPEVLARSQTSFLTAAERRLLIAICSKLPSWVTPNRLTALGLAGALLTGTAYALSELDPLWLSAAILGCFINWFGDSLDGTLARYRKVEQPDFGYFIDHSCDGLATLLILGGLGASPYVRGDVGLFVAAGYLLVSVHTFLVARVTNVFKVSQAAFGPTEARLLLIALTIAMFILGPDSGRIGAFNGFDLIVGGAGLLLILIFVVQTARVGHDLLKRMDVPTAT